MKKILTLFAALAFLIFGGACFTPELYEKSADEYRNFVEEISTFLITQDGKSLIVVGKQHHYIFDANDTLKFILTWSEKNRVKASFENFFIDSEQYVSGYYILTVDARQGLSNDAQKQLVSKGFTKNKSQKTLSYRGSVQGTRYLGDKFNLPATMQLNQKYSINIREHQISASTTIKRILLTPLAVVGDGLLLMGSIPVLLLAIPLAGLP